jgi:hypothetical protein
MTDFRLRREARRELAMWTLIIVGLSLLLGPRGYFAPNFPLYGVFIPAFGGIVAVMFLWIVVHVVFVVRPRAKRARRDGETLRKAMEGATRIEMTKEA